MTEVAKLFDRLRKVKAESCADRMDPELYQDGVGFLVVANPRASVIEAWVKAVAKDAGVRVDWHFAGGRARVCAMPAELEQAKAAARRLLPALQAAWLVSEENTIPCDLYSWWAT